MHVCVRAPRSAVVDFYRPGLQVMYITAATVPLAGTAPWPQLTARKAGEYSPAACPEMRESGSGKRLAGGY